MIYLASKSPRRKQLLQQIEIPFTCLEVDIDETVKQHESADQLVVRLAREKSLQGWLHPNRTQQLPVLGADTLGVLNQKILNKPEDLEHAKEMLNAMSGQTHQILTAICFCFQGNFWQTLTHSDVTFRNISEAEIEEYWNTGESKGKAGAYAIQGIAGKFVTHMSGSYSAIVGLPLQQTFSLLQTIMLNK